MYNTCIMKLSEHIHLLLPKTDMVLLKMKAEKENVSMATLIRRAIHQVYRETNPNERQQAFERLKQRNELNVCSWEQMKKDLLKRYE